MRGLRQTESEGEEMRKVLIYVVWMVVWSALLAGLILVVPGWDMPDSILFGGLGGLAAVVLEEISR